MATPATPITRNRNETLQANLTLQETIKDKLNNAITTINGFINRENFADSLSTPIIENSIKLMPNNSYNNPELSKYINSYNSSVALLDDPNNMTRTAFDTYLHIQNNKIKKLNENLENINKKIKKTTPIPVKAFRNMENSKILNVEEYPSSTDNTSAKYPNYLIYGNNGCLQYDSTATSASSISFKSCDANDSRQQFNMNQINNISQYNTPITNISNERYKLASDTSTQFGFYTVNPSNANDQCLQLNNDGLSIMPCTMNSAQRFKPMYHTVLE